MGLLFSFAGSTDSKNSIDNLSKLQFQVLIMFLVLFYIIFLVLFYIIFSNIQLYRYIFIEKTVSVFLYQLKHHLYHKHEHQFNHSSSCMCSSHAHDGDRLQFGRLCFTVRLTPGHTSGHVVYVLEGGPFGAPLSLFSGDHLFLAGIGQ